MAERATPVLPTPSPAQAIEGSAIWHSFFANNTEVLKALQEAVLFVGDMGQGTNYPTTTDIPAGRTRVWHNTTTGVTRLYVNVAGSLKFTVLT